MPVTSMKSPKLTALLVVGPSTPIGEQVLEALSQWTDPLQLVGASTGEAVGREFDWRGEACVVVDQATVRGQHFDAVILAAPMAEADLPKGAVVIALPGAQRTGRLVLPGIGEPPHAGEWVRTPDTAATIAATVVRALAPILDVVGVEAVVLESASSMGRAAMDELRDQTIDLLNFREARTEVFPQRLAFDVLPRGAEAANAFAEDLRGLFPGLQAHATRVWVHAFVGQAISLRLHCAGPVDVARVQQVLAADDRFSLEAPHPGLAAAVGDDQIHVGQPLAVDGVLHLWLTADDTRIGSALPAVLLIERAA